MSRSAKRTCDVCGWGEHTSLERLDPEKHGPGHYRHRHCMATADVARIHAKAVAAEARLKDAEATIQMLRDEIHRLRMTPQYTGSF